MEYEKGVNLFTLLFSQFHYYAGVDQISYFFAEIIDADYMACHKEASIFSQKETTVGLLFRFGELDAEKEIDKEEPAVIPVFKAGTTAGATLLLFTSPAYLYDPFHSHLLAGGNNGGLQMCQEIPKPLFFEKIVSKLLITVLGPGNLFLNGT